MLPANEVIPLNSGEGTVFLNVILPMAYSTSKLYCEGGRNKMAPLASKATECVDLIISLYLAAKMLEFLSKAANSPNDLALLMADDMGAKMPSNVTPWHADQKSH